MPINGEEDASAIVALLFNELTQKKVVARLRGASLHAPSLLEFEMANACLKCVHCPHCAGAV
jgi:predicted nucleic acid-binding protein